MNLKKTWFLINSIKIVSAHKMFIYKKQFIKKTQNAMYKATIKKKKSGESCLLFTLLLGFKKHKKKLKRTHKNNNQLITVFIWFIKQFIIKPYLFFAKNRVVFNTNKSKKTKTILIKTITKKELTHKTRIRLKTC